MIRWSTSNWLDMAWTQGACFRSASLRKTARPGFGIAPKSAGMRNILWTEAPCLQWKTSSEHPKDKPQTSLLYDNEFPSDGKGSATDVESWIPQVCLSEQGAHNLRESQMFFFLNIICLYVYMCLYHLRGSFSTVPGGHQVPRPLATATPKHLQRF